MLSIVLGSLLILALLVVVIWRVISEYRGRERAKVRAAAIEFEIEYVDRVMMRAIESKDDHIMMLASGVEQGHIAERMLVASLNQQMSLFIIGSCVGLIALAIQFPQFRDGLFLVAFFAGGGSAVLMHYHGRMVDRLRAQQNRRTKFYVQILESVVDGNDFMKQELKRQINQDDADGDDDPTGPKVPA